MEDDLDTSVLPLIHDHIDGEVLRLEGDRIVDGNDVRHELKTFLAFVVNRQFPAVAEGLVGEGDLNGLPLFRLPLFLICIKNRDVKAGENITRPFRSRLSVSSLGFIGSIRAQDHIKGKIPPGLDEVLSFRLHGSSHRKSAFDFYVLGLGKEHLSFGSNKFLAEISPIPELLGAILFDGLFFNSID